MKEFTPRMRCNRRLRHGTVTPLASSSLWRDLSPPAAPQFESIGGDGIALQHDRREPAPERVMTRIIARWNTAAQNARYGGRGASEFAPEHPPSPCSLPRIIQHGEQDFARRGVDLRIVTVARARDIQAPDEVLYQPAA